MAVSRKLLWIVGMAMFMNPILAQVKLTDSISQAVQNAGTYEEQLAILLTSIDEIYTTKYDETILLARQGYRLAQQKNDRLNKGDFLRRIGLAMGKKGKIDSASYYYYKSLKELEPTGNVEKLGLLYDDMARMYRKLEQKNRALEFYDKALALYQSENDQEGIARIYNESGVVYRDSGDYKKADELFKKSLRIQQQRNDSVGIGYALEFLGYNQLLIKNYTSSEKYLQQALKIREKIGEDFAIMLSYTSLGEFYKATKQHLLSNDYFQKSNSKAQKIKFLDIQRYNNSQILENYEAIGNYEEAYKHLQAFKKLDDSLYNAQKLKDVEEITTKYETAEKEKALAENEISLKIRNQWILGLIALAVIVGLIGFLLYKQQVLKNIQQQNDNALQLAHEKIASQNRLEQQRLNISRDLHDNIGAQLTFIISAIDTIKYYSSDIDQNLSNRLTKISSFAKETIQELRDTIWAMNKSTLSIEDLISRIANYIEKAKQSQDTCNVILRLNNSDKNEMSFTGLQALNIFRILQEACNNALKYAAAKEIQVQIKSQGETTYFAVVDNGSGFIEKEIEPGNGLLNMRKRALELKSELDINSSANSGTVVSFQVSNQTPTV